MSFSINLFWRQAPRHAIARLDLGRLRQLLQLLTEQGEFPADAIHCDPRVQARDVSIARQSLARIARAIDADHTTIGVMDEAQFTRSKLRILICPITRHPLLAVSPVIDIDIPNNYFDHIAEHIQRIQQPENWSAGSVSLNDLNASMAQASHGMVFNAFRQASNTLDVLAPYLTTPRNVDLRWQTRDGGASPTRPLTFPKCLIKNQYTLDPATGRMFATIEHGKNLFDACISGSTEAPGEWDRILAIAANGNTSRIGSFSEGQPPRIDMDFGPSSAPTTIEYHHDEATPQPALRVSEPAFA